MRIQGFLLSFLVVSLANAADQSTVQLKTKAISMSPQSVTYCFGKARCFEVTSKLNRFHAIERLQETPFKVTEINKSTFDRIKNGAQAFETWAKKASAKSKNILGCRHEFSVTESKATRTICLDNIDDKEKSKRSNSLISLFTQAKAVAQTPAADSAPTVATASTPIPECGPAGPTDDVAVCTVEEIPQFPGNKRK